MKNLAMTGIGLALSAFTTFSSAAASTYEVSDTLVELVKDFEGYRETAYDDLDPARQLAFGDDHLAQGTLTIGWGCTTDVYAGQRISVEDAEKCLTTNLVTARQVVDDVVDVSLNSNQRDALVSFVFNVGEGQFRNSTLLRKLNAGDYKGAESEFHRWVYSGGRKLQGLIQRRIREAALFALPSIEDAFSLPIDLLSNPSLAPDVIRIPGAVTQAMHSAWATSFPGGRSAPSREVGGVIVKQPDGNIVAKYVTIGTNARVLINRWDAKAGERIIGTYHTHPYSDVWPEGGYLGVAHSGDDFTYALVYREPTFVEAGSKQFLLLPTEISPEHPVEAWDPLGSQFTEDLNKLTFDQGIPVPEAHIIVGKRYAKRYGIAFYEGVNGVFRRIG